MRNLLYLLAALALFLAPGCKKRVPEQARVDAALAPLLPADTVLAACLRLDHLKKTPLWERYVASRRIKPLEEFREKTGLDPLKDIWELVAVTNGSRNLVFVRGKFGGQFGLEPKLDLPGAARMSHKGYYMLGSEQAAVLFLNTGAAVAGAANDLRKIIDDRDNPAAVPPPDLLELLKNVPGGAHFWMVTTSGAKLVPELPDSGPLANAAKVAASLRDGWMWADFEQGVRLHAEGHYPNGEAARQIHDALRGLVGIARLRTPEDKPELLRVYDGFQTKVREETLVVDYTAPQDLVDQLATLFGERVVRSN